MTKKVQKPAKKEQSASKTPNFLQKYAFVLGLVLFACALSFTALYAYGNYNNSRQGRSQVKCEVAACISLKENAADPNIVSVANGSFVQFNSSDGKKHNISLAHSGAQHDDPQRYESGDFGADEAWKVQFKKDGAYSFRDKYNDNITVSVVVSTPGKDYKIE